VTGAAAADAHDPGAPDRILWALAEDTAGVTGQAFLEAIVEKLARLLDVAFVTVAIMDDAAPGRARVIACWKDAGLREGYEFALAGTPCEVVVRGQVHFVPCNLAEMYPAERGTGSESYLGIPLFDTDGTVMGHVAVHDTRPLSDGDRRVAIIRLFALRAEAELRRMRLEAELRRLAATDELTGAANRRSFLDAASRELDRARRYALPLAAMMLDLDLFKKVNDELGHAAGDDVLRAFADAVRELIRQTDVLGRLGGEEFALLLPHTEVGGAMVLAERIRERVRDAVVDTREGPVRVTVSIGVAALDHSDLGVEDLIRRADDALYAAKRTGRDRVVFSAFPEG
jgi:diguanylate cyclase (GGDEF)-like protein